jgi:DNA repair photolyase
MQVREVRVRSILTRTTGYLRTIASHSLQPYRGCSFGRSLCGAACYVRHNVFLTRGQEWGSFLDVRVNAAPVYRAQHRREGAWGRRSRGGFAIFLSSATDPFLPQESRARVTRSVLEAMCELPPDLLILQTHSHRVLEVLDLLPALARRCELRVHVSIESDRDRLPGLPPPGSPVRRRMDAARRLREAGLHTVVTVSPLHPIALPEAFFRALGECADAVVLDHFIGGDGSPEGSRTRRTALPAAMAAVEPGSLCLDYRDRMVEVARRLLPGRVGVGIDGFAGRLLPA